MRPAIRARRAAVEAAGGPDRLQRARPAPDDGRLPAGELRMAGLHREAAVRAGGRGPRLLNVPLPAPERCCARSAWRTCRSRATTWATRPRACAGPSTVCRRCCATSRPAFHRRGTEPLVAPEATKDLNARLFARLVARDRAGRSGAAGGPDDVAQRAGASTALARAGLPFLDMTRWRRRQARRPADRVQRQPLHRARQPGDRRLHGARGGTGAQPLRERKLRGQAPERRQRVEQQVEVVRDHRAPCAAGSTDGRPPPASRGGSSRTRRPCAGRAGWPGSGSSGRGSRSRRSCSSAVR